MNKNSAVSLSSYITIVLTFWLVVATLRLSRNTYRETVALRMEIEQLVAKAK